MCIRDRPNPTDSITWYNILEKTKTYIDMVIDLTAPEPIPQIVIDKYRFIIDCLHNENKAFIFATAESNQNVYQIAQNILDKNYSTLQTIEETITAIITQMNGEIKGQTYGGLPL